jgi:hypothetical protein
MKAKEYAALFNANPTNEVIVDIGVKFWGEVDVLMKARNVKTDSAALAILNELDKKWLAFSRLCDGKVNPNGFHVIIRELMPEVYRVWKH